MDVENPQSPNFYNSKTPLDLDNYINSISNTDDYNANIALYDIFIRKGFENGFSGQDIVTVLMGYQNHGGLVSVNRHEITDNWAIIASFYKNKSWTEEQAMEFQTMIMTNPSMEGFLNLFLKHPTYLQIIGTNTDRQAVLRIIDHSNHHSSHHGSNHHDSHDGLNRDDWENMYGRNRITFGKYDNDNNAEPSTRVIFTSQISNDDDEGFLDPYQLHKTIVTDPEEIEFMEIQPRYSGITFVWETEVNSQEDIDLHSIFDYLRSFKVDTECIMVLTIGEINGASSWAKDIRVVPGSWYNFSEKLLPYNNLYFKFGLKLVTGMKEKINLKIMGIFLKDMVRANLGEKLSECQINPMKYGFRRHFELTE